jgi:hypothetical protein
MLTEEEKEELKMLARSPVIRDEFRLLRRHSRAVERMNVDRLIGFLTVMSQLTTQLRVPRPAHGEQMKI